jgi:hypothetical protein
VARRLAPARVEVAYPGLWLRPDVYATHGHYLDVHLTIPRLECLAIATVRRLLGEPPAGPAGPADYEALVAPVYALAYGLAQGVSPSRGLAATEVSTRVWRRLDGASPRDLGARLLGGLLLPGAVAALNRAGLGPFTADLTGHELRRAGLAAMAEVVERLGVGAEHVVFGHTHRPGPLSEEAGFDLPGGRRLTNTGSWVLEAALAGRDLERSPYRPGVVARVGPAGPPELVNVLDSAALAEATRAPAPAGG